MSHPTSHPRHVVHLITGLELGGAERMLHKLLQHRDPSRFTESVISMTGDGDLGAELRAIGVPLYSLDMRAGRPDPRGLLRLWRLLRHLHPDLLQSWLYHADLFAMLLARACGVPRLVWNLRCSYMALEHYALSLRLVLRLLAWGSSGPAWLRPDAVLVNSTAGQHWHTQLGYRPRRWQRIDNGFDLQRYRPDPAAGAAWRRLQHIPEDAVVIGMVARLDPMKGYTTLLEAVAPLLRPDPAHPGVHVVLAGPEVRPETPFFADTLARLGLHDATGRTLHLLGPRSDIPELHAALDIAVSASIGEGFANVIGEAMACGIPCVVTDVGDSAWIVGDTGLVVPPQDPTALTRALLAMIEQGPEARRHLGQAARNRMVAGFSLAQIAAHYHDFYTSILEGTETPCAE
jgi:glycosyltransferase involved in cell wall biosynthesis